MAKARERRRKRPTRKDAEQIAVQLLWPGSNASYSQAFNPSTIGPTAINWFATNYLDGVKGAPSSLAA